MYSFITKIRTLLFCELKSAVIAVKQVIICHVALRGRGIRSAQQKTRTADAPGFGSYFRDYPVTKQVVLEGASTSSHHRTTRILRVNQISCKLFLR